MFPSSTSREPPSDDESKDGSSSQKPEADEEKQHSESFLVVSSDDSLESEASPNAGLEASTTSVSEEPGSRITLESSKHTSITVSESDVSYPSRALPSVSLEQSTCGLVTVGSLKSDRKETSPISDSDSFSSLSSNISVDSLVVLPHDPPGEDISADNARSSKKKSEHLELPSPSKKIRLSSHPVETIVISDSDSHSQSLGSFPKLKDDTHKSSTGVEEMESEEDPSTSYTSSRAQPSQIDPPLESFKSAFQSPLNISFKSFESHLQARDDDRPRVGIQFSSVSAGMEKMVYKKTPSVTSASLHDRPFEDNICEAVEMVQGRDYEKVLSHETITLSSGPPSPALPAGQQGETSERDLSQEAARQNTTNVAMSSQFHGIAESGPSTSKEMKSSSTGLCGSATDSPYRVSPTDLRPSLYLPPTEFSGSARSSPSMVPRFTNCHRIDGRSSDNDDNDISDLSGGVSCDMTINSYSFEWKTCRDNECEKGCCEKSELFYAGLVWQTEWSLHFFPNGLEDAEDCSTSLRLVLEKGEANGSVVARFSVKRHDLEQPIYSSSHEGRIYKEMEFLTVKNFVPITDIGQNTITIICELYIGCEEKNRLSPYSYIVEDLNTICNDFLMMYKKRMNCDANLVVTGGITFAVHKFIIVARSKFLARMLRVQNFLVYDMVNAKEMDELLTYIYSGKYPVWNARETKRMREVAHYFSVQGLEDICDVLCHVKTIKPKVNEPTNSLN